MDKLHALYSQSPKNMRELEEHARDVGDQVLKIGRVLNTRWVASSFRTVSSVWKNYVHLCGHFETLVKIRQDWKQNKPFSEASGKKFVPSSFFLTWL